jgi:hypothetical protein
LAGRPPRAAGAPMGATGGFAAVIGVVGCVPGVETTPPC